MRIIVQTAETVVIYRSYEVEADSVVSSRKADLKDLRPSGQRQVTTGTEHRIGAADRSYLIQTHRLNEYLDCKDEW